MGWVVHVARMGPLGNCFALKLQSFFMWVKCHNIVTMCII